MSRLLRVPRAAAGKPQVQRSRVCAARTSPVLPFALLCRAEGLPEPVAEYRFHPERRWRFDYAWPDRKIAVEQEGAIWAQGRHTRGSGFVNDIEKYNTAAALGWCVLRGTPAQVASGELIPLIRQAMEADF